MYIQLSEVMYYALLDPDMDFIFKERGRFNVKASIDLFITFFVIVTWALVYRFDVIVFKSQSTL